MNTKKMLRGLVFGVCFLVYSFNATAQTDTVAHGTCGENLTWVLTEDSVLTINGSGDMKNYSYPSTNPPWFNNNNLIKNVVMEDGITSIGHCAFVYASNLLSVDVPNSVKMIGASSFSMCTRLTTITIGSGVDSLWLSAFASCPALISINVSPNNLFYASEDGVLFNKAKTTLLRFPQAKPDANYLIPNTVTTLAGSSSSGIAAFADCKRIKAVVMPNSVKEIGVSTFWNCDSLVSVTIGNSVDTIRFNTFSNCKSLKYVTIGESVSAIENQAFSGCSSLKSITIPKSVTAIGGVGMMGTFGGFVFTNTALDTMIIKATIPPFTSQSSFSGVSKNISIFIPCGSLAAYQDSNNWKDFTNFIEVPITTDIFDVICEGETYYKGNGFEIFDGAGIYYDTLQSSLGCDSIVCLTLTELEIPSNVSVSKVGNSFLITWQGEAISYVLYRNNDSLTTLTTTTYTDTDLTDGEEYCYKIKAIAANCETEFSEEICETFNTVSIVGACCIRPIQIFPNPTTGQITIKNYELKINNIEIYDIVGKLQESRISEIGKSEIVLDVSHLANGLYFLKVDNKVIKIIKE